MKNIQSFETIKYAFTITGCYKKNIANTEYDIFICRTIENKIIIFLLLFG